MADVDMVWRWLFRLDGAFHQVWNEYTPMFPPMKFVHFELAQIYKILSLRHILTLAATDLADGIVN